ncbi:MAG: pyridoxamine 5'-phosphate oxidase [Bacteroidetes bacterium]|nr:pyridoxamine 5'-phosphate oxidase [Bacteroidota bacterium]
MEKLLKIRKEYMMAALDEVHTLDHPVEQFKIWFGEALKASVAEPNAMMLATANEQGQPSARIVLVREIEEAGLGFYTNYNSHKGHDLDVNPRAALTFFWPDLERQVRFEGLVHKQPREVSETYFAQRPRGSQIGAWTSPQSSRIESRHVLVENEHKYTSEFEGKEVSCPPHWGGYFLRIHFAEFWQGRENRLHDRICYELNKDGLWTKFRKAP